jgi:hypothetical protein
MDHIFDPVPVAHDRVGLGDLAVDSGHARLQRVSLRTRKNAQTHARKGAPPQLNVRLKKKRKKTHIVLDRAVPELRGYDLQYLSVEPATFGHRRVGVPIWRDLAQARMCCGRGCRRWSGDGIRSHGRKEHATDDVSELVRGWDEDKREMDLVGVEGEDGQRRFQLRVRVWTGQGRDQRTQLELVINMSGAVMQIYAPPALEHGTSILGFGFLVMGGVSGGFG